MTGFTNRSYWCDHCDKGFDHKDRDDHPCEGRTCRACKREHDNPCPNYNKCQKPTIPCRDCRFKFYGEDCLHHHKVTGRCEKYKKCPDCKAGYKVDKKHGHVCGEGECYSCGKMVMIATHKCYIQRPYEPPPPKQRSADGESSNEKPPPKMVYADIECLLTEERGFIPNLLCYRVQDQRDITTLRGEDCVQLFLNHLEDYSHPANEDIEEQPLIIMFHNLKGFDGIFLLQELYKAPRTVEEQLTIGAKVLSFKSGPLVFKDSLCFLPMPLSSFPSTFGLTELKKGFFPHAFNLPSNQDYVGTIPELRYFDPEGMSTKMKTELEQWHAEQVRRGVEYNFQQELQDYCKSDVDILQSGCEAFCEEFEKYAKFNPFAECYTIASACNRYWRKVHLVEDTIAVEPPQGWRGAQVNQSLVALQWLHYQESLLPKAGACADRIQHVRNGGEKKLLTEKGKEYVDGWDEQTNTVYEFMGCLWHGCPTCCKHQRSRCYGANPDRTLEELYEATLDKIQRLERAGYTVMVEWECEWEKKVKSTPVIRNFLSTLDMVPPLQPREAFFGGRTGAVALYHQVGPGEKIYYVDVTSLYPWVNKTQEYPLDHPEIKCPPASQDLADYFGLATVTILPPRGLYHPVLPVHHGGKLTFPLCMACVREQQAKPMLERSALCTHTNQERQLRGTWCTPEIEKAVEMNYRLIHIHEVWHFPQREAGLFQPYVDTWLKLKQESAGWPRCTTEEDKARYLRQYQEREGIRLQNVKKNPGRKQVAKLMLNSFWGKFGEKTNKSKVEQVVRPHQLYKILTDSADLQTLRICTDDVLEVVYKQTEDNDLPSDRTNIFIAAFTTCWARLKLYSYLERLGEQVLYYDTDSVIYRWKPGQCQIETGDFLGEMTDELDGDHIIEFVSGGAKNYGYQTAGGKFECKVRGFTLNVRGRQVLNYHTMKENILSELEDPEDRTIAVKNPNHFKRDSVQKKIRLVEQVKNYRLVFDKRVVDPVSKRSHPFGYY